MVRAVDISRYQEALCKMDYLVLCDGGSVCVRPESEVGVWTTIEG